jgi:hypothetical protein
MTEAGNIWVRLGLKGQDQFGRDMKRAAGTAERDFMSPMKNSLLSVRRVIGNFAFAFAGFGLMRSVIANIREMAAAGKELTTDQSRLLRYTDALKQLSLGFGNIILTLTAPAMKESLKTLEYLNTLMSAGAMGRALLPGNAAMREKQSEIGELFEEIARLKGGIDFTTSPLDYYFAVTDINKKTAALKELYKEYDKLKQEYEAHPMQGPEVPLPNYRDEEYRKRIEREKAIKPTEFGKSAGWGSWQWDQQQMGLRADWIDEELNAEMEKRKLVAEAGAQAEIDAQQMIIGAWQERYEFWDRFIAYPMEDFIVDMVSGTKNLHDAWHAMLQGMLQSLTRFMAETAVIMFIKLLASQIPGMGGIIGFFQNARQMPDLSGGTRQSIGGGFHSGLSGSGGQGAAQVRIYLDRDEIGYRMEQWAEFNGRRGI